MCEEICEIKSIEIYSDKETSDNSLLSIKGLIIEKTSKIKKIYICINGSRYRIKHKTLCKFEQFFENSSNSKYIDKKVYFWDIFKIQGSVDITNISLTIIFCSYSTDYSISPDSISFQKKNKSYNYSLSQKIQEKIDFLNSNLVICMGTYYPDISLFTDQLFSIVKQTYGKWFLLIADDCSDTVTYSHINKVISQLNDDRIFIYQNAENMGFYRNYEQILSYIPRATKYIALCDQDDFWYDNKLETLIKKIEENEDTAMVFSDMRIVDQNRRTLSNSFWNYRTNHYNDLESLFFINCVTGASLVFKGYLLPKLLPFPKRQKATYHDHWIALNAISIGNIVFVKTPLYEYIQHQRNVIGHDLRSISNKEVILHIFKRIYYSDYSMNKVLSHIFDEECYRIQLLSNIILLRNGEGVAKFDSLISLSQYGNHFSSVFKYLIRHILYKRNTMGLDMYIFSSFFFNIVTGKFDRK